MFILYWGIVALQYCVLPQVFSKVIQLLKYGALHEFACYTCAGAMLIFFVSFQF